jgi:hypothetical protein
VHIWLVSTDSRCKGILRLRPNRVTELRKNAVMDRNIIDVSPNSCNQQMACVTQVLARRIPGQACIKGITGQLALCAVSKQLSVNSFGFLWRLALQDLYYTVADDDLNTSIA